MLNIVQGAFKTFYQALVKATLIPVAMIFWRYVPLSKFFGHPITLWTANRVTILRTLTVFPIVVLLWTNQFRAALTWFICAGIADFLDGQVSRAHQWLKHHDDERLGKFIDAFCDKIWWGVGHAGALTALIVVVLYLFNGGNGEWIHIAICSVYMAISIPLMHTEYLLANIRLEDYKKSCKLNLDAGDLKAPMSGKLKFVLEVAGTSCLIHSLPEIDTWAGYTGILCLAVALPFAHRSMLTKMRRREAIS